MRRDDKFLKIRAMHIDKVINIKDVTVYNKEVSRARENSKGRDRRGGLKRRDAFKIKGLRFFTI